MTKDIGGIEPLPDLITGGVVHYKVKTSGGFWALEDGSTRHLHLLTPEELLEVPAGAVLTSIMGNNATVGKDDIDDDTRYGYTAWGFICPFEHDVED